MITVDPGYIQIGLTAALVSVTIIYAWRTHVISRAAKEQAEATRKQAEASVKMAEEMREQRYDAVRPVIDIYRDQTDEDKLPEAFAGKSGDTSRGLACVLHNIGLGPAIDLYSFVQNPFSGKRQHYDFGTIATGEKTPKMNLSVKQKDGRMALLAYYKDVYGRAFESSREVSSDKEKGWQLGPLKIRPVMEDELP